MGYNVNDTVNVQGRGDFAVAAKRAIQRGRHAGQTEYTLAPLAGNNLGGKAFAMRVTGDHWFAPAKGSYTSTQVTEAVAKVHVTKGRIADRREKRAAEGREVIGEQRWVSGQGWTASNINPGDMVQIRYRGGSKRWENVVKINATTGKVAVASDYSKRGYRWIPATQVVDVTRKA